MTAFLQDGPRAAPNPAVIEQSADLGRAPTVGPELSWGVIGSLVLLAVFAAVVAWHLRRGARRAQPAAERAFLQVCRKLGLDRECRALLRELAAACGEQALALVVSPGALRAAISRVDRGAWEKRKAWSKVVELGTGA